MSWNVTGTGSKAALHKELDRYFDPKIAQSKDTPHEKEYSAAKAALGMLIESAPDGHILKIESGGSAGYEATYPSFSAKIDLKLIAPTFKE